MFGNINIFRVRKVYKMNYWIINEWREWNVDHGIHGVCTYKYKTGYQLFSSKQEAEEAAAKANLIESIEALEEGYNPSAFKDTFKGTVQQYVNSVFRNR